MTVFTSFLFEEKDTSNNTNSQLFELLRNYTTKAGDQGDVICSSVEKLVNALKK